MARPVGVITRGTTAPNRLRRVDRWLLRTYGTWLKSRTNPLIVDLGYGANPTTTVEMFTRIREHGVNADVLGLEIDPERVTVAKVMERPHLSFAVGGFELPAPRKPDVVRAFNVLRQYDEDAVVPTWNLLARGMADGGLLVEGTCNEIGRIATWVTLRADGDQAVPLTLTLASRLGSLDRPATFAERLPKALIHRNVSGEPIHRFLAELDHAWQVAAGVGALSARQRWVSACESVLAAGWPIKNGRSAWRDGELTVEWSAVAPRA
jgi:hypothetical protein